MSPTMTLADLAATSLSAIRILEQHGLDYCCGGKQPFEEACLAKGVKPQTIIREIEEAKVASTEHAPGGAETGSIEGAPRKDSPPMTTPSRMQDR